MSVPWAVGLLGCRVEVGFCWLLLTSLLLVTMMPRLMPAASLVGLLSGGRRPIAAWLPPSCEQFGVGWQFHVVVVLGSC
jgi:hypothetical protein